jgi:hypothetical protein
LSSSVIATENIFSGNNESNFESLRKDSISHIAKVQPHIVTGSKTGNLQQYHVYHTDSLHRHDSLYARPQIIPVDTPGYARPWNTISWDSLMLHDVSGISKHQIVKTPKPVYFADKATTLNTLKSDNYKQFTEKPAAFCHVEPFTSTFWFLATVFTCLILYTWLQYFFKKNILQMLYAAFNGSVAARIFRDKNLLIERVFIFLNLFYALTGSLFLFQILKHYQIAILNFNDVRLFMFSLGIILGLFGIRSISTRFIGFLFNRSSEMKEYGHLVFLIYKILGLFLFPIVIFMAYVPDIHKNILIAIALAVIAFFSILRFLRGVILLKEKGFLLFYIILYFCTIEILPTLLVVRWLYLNL